MSYIGNKPSQTLASPTSQYFNGTGSQTVFTLNRLVNVSEDLEVFVNNIQQEPGVGKSYTATGSTLTFDAAPSAGTSNVYVVYRGLAEITTRLEHDPNAALAATTGTFTGDLTVDTNTLYVDSANNRIGINTITPSETLHVEEATTGNAVRVSRGGNYIIMGGSGSGTQYVKGYEGTIAFGNAFAGNTTFLTDDTERMRITSYGDVGIGRPDPQNIVGNSGGGLVVRSGASRAATTSLFAVQDSSGNNSFLQLHNGETTFSVGAIGSKTEAMQITSAGDVLGTDFVMTFNPSFPPSGTGTYYQNGALTSTDASLINTLAPCNFKIKELKVYVNSALTSGSATVAILKDGSTTGNLSIGTGTNVHSLTSFLANNSFAASSNNRIGARIILSGTSPAWYHISIRCERI